MCKKMVAFLLSLVMIFTMLPSMFVTAEATEPVKVSQAEATAQLNYLIDEFVNEGTFYFSKKNVACAFGHSGCSKCDITAVVQESWFKDKVKRVPNTENNGYLYHWYTNDWNGKKPLGKACCGFANFAGWYIFSQKSTDQVVFEPLVINDSRAQEEFEYGVLKNARPGDILRFNDGYLVDPYDESNPSDHSAIFISCNKDGVTVLDCNSGNKKTGQNSQIKKHTYKFSDCDYNYVTISRAENYDVESTQLPAPTISITNVASTGKPRITWDAVPSAAKYEVYRAESSNGTYTKISTPTGTTVTNTKAVVGETYWYKVRAIATDGSPGVFSAVKKRTCDLPMPNVHCENITSSGAIKISWDAVEGADYYQLYRSTKPEEGTYKQWDGNLTKLTYSNLNQTVPGTTYYYKVIAYMNDNANATSEPSEHASATRKCAQPVLEADTPNDAATGKPRLSWAAVDGAERYRVGRATSANGTYNFLEYAEGTTWIDTSAVPGETYYYKVRAAAENSAGNSAMSAYVKRTCSLSKRPGVTANGMITSYLSDTNDITVALFAEGSTEADYTTTVKGNSATYSIDGVTAGTYTMKVSKLNHVTREYTVVVADADVTQDAKIHPKGDVDGNGTVTTMDFMRVNSHARSVTLLTGYALACADVVGTDGAVTTMDAMRINAHAKETNMLW